MRSDERAGARCEEEEERRVGRTPMAAEVEKQDALPVIEACERRRASAAQDETSTGKLASSVLCCVERRLRSGNATGAGVVVRGDFPSQRPRAASRVSRAVRAAVVVAGFARGAGWDSRCCVFAV